MLDCRRLLGHFSIFLSDQHFARFCSTLPDLASTHSSNGSCPLGHGSGVGDNGGKGTTRGNSAAFFVSLDAFRRTFAPREHAVSIVDSQPSTSWKLVSPDLAVSDKELDEDAPADSTEPADTVSLTGTAADVAKASAQRRERGIPQRRMMGRLAPSRPARR